MVWMPLAALILFLSWWKYRDQWCKDAICFVITETPGARIFINGQPTELRTPAQVPLRKGEVVQITLKKKNYEDVQRYVRCQADRCFTYVELKRLRPQLTLVASSI